MALDLQLETLTGLVVDDVAHMIPKGCQGNIDRNAGVRSHEIFVSAPRRIEPRRCGRTPTAMAFRNLIAAFTALLAFQDTVRLTRSGRPCGARPDCDNWAISPKGAANAP